MRGTNPAPMPPPEQQFLTRFETARILGRDQVTVSRMEAAEQLGVVRSKGGHVLYTRKSVEAVVARWNAQAQIAAANRATVIPPGWRLLIQNARGPFIGESIPEAPGLIAQLGREVGLEVIPAVVRRRRCIVSYARLDEAFKVAQAEGLNIISNGRGIVAVKEGK